MERDQVPSSSPERAAVHSKEHLESALANLEECKGCLETALAVLDNSNDAEPYRVLGIRADSALVSSFVSLTVGFYSTIFSLYTKSDDNSIIEGMFNI